MKGDVFNNCCASANGDIISAIGDINESCKLNLPYSDSRIQLLRDNVSITLANKAKATAQRDVSKKDWQDCKRKVFARCNSQNDRLNQAEAALMAAEAAYNAAVQELNNALAANKVAQGQYDTCHTQEIQRQKELDAQEAERQRLAAEKEKLDSAERQRLAEIEANKTVETEKASVAKLNIQSTTSLEKKKVAAQQLETGKDYAKYGFIAVGLFAALFFGFKYAKR